MDWNGFPTVLASEIGFFPKLDTLHQWRTVYCYYICVYFHFFSPALWKILSSINYTEGFPILFHAYVSIYVIHNFFSFCQPRSRSRIAFSLPYDVYFMISIFWFPMAFDNRGNNFCPRKVPNMKLMLNIFNLVCQE